AAAVARAVVAAEAIAAARAAAAALTGAATDAAYAADTARAARAARAAGSTRSAAAAVASASTAAAHQAEERGRAVRRAEPVIFEVRRRRAAGMNRVRHPHRDRVAHAADEITFDIRSIRRVLRLADHFHRRGRFRDAVHVGPLLDELA